MLGLGINTVIDTGWSSSSLLNVLAGNFQARVLADGGEVENMVCLNKDLIDLTNGSDSLLIDRYASPAAAYSLRKLRRDYLGPAIRVRRDSDSEELDIFFNSDGSLDTASLEAFCSGTYGYVDTWYDQANGNDAEQNTPSDQPKIYHTTYDNALLQSNNFGETWTTIGTLASGETGYDGSDDAWLFTSGGVTNPLAQANSNSGVQTFSAYFKKNASYGVRMFIVGTINRWAFFDLSDGSIPGDSGLIDRNVEEIGSDWYRCSVTYNDTNTAIRLYVTDNATTQVVGSITIQDAQLETGDTATDYVETTTAPAVRMGYVVTENGKPAVEFDGGDTLSHSSNLSLAACSIFTILEATAAIRVWYGPDGQNYLATFSAYISSVAGGSPRLADNTIGGQTLYNFTRDGFTGGTWYKNSSALTTTGPQTTETLSLNSIGGFSIYKHVGTIQEIIVYPSDETSNRTNIETNINDYYNIYS